MNTDAIITLLSLGTIITQLGLIFTIVVLLINKRLLLHSFIRNNLDKGLFLTALVATSGSLFFSQIALFAPCELCWFQRIFMYPLAILFGLAWYWQERVIYKYTTPLVTAGWLVALYHNYIYYQGIHSTACSMNNADSCITPYFTKFGYIGIPVMSLTAFSLIGVMLIILKLNQSTSGKS